MTLLADPLRHKAVLELLASAPSHNLLNRGRMTQGMRRSEPTPIGRPSLKASMICSKTLELIESSDL
jgi:hypothetical protein